METKEGRWVWAATSFGCGRAEDELDTCALSYPSRVEARQAAEQDLGWVVTRWEVWFEADARGCYLALFEEGEVSDQLGRLDVWCVN